MKELVIDTSHWDGDIDLQRWKNDRGLWGVIIKAGGNESSLGRYQDGQFNNTYKKAISLGLHVGAYYYTVSTSTSESKKDAEHFAQLLSGKDFDLPCYIDVEDPRQFRLSARDLTDVIAVFCDTLNSKGYYAGLYTGGNAWLNNMYPSELSKYANWIAWWRAAWPSEAGDIGMWQQGTMRLSDGAIFFDDVSGCTDFDWCVIDYPSRIKKQEKPSSTTEQPKEEKKEVTHTADDVIRVAESQLGYYAPDDPERGSKYGRWMAQLFNEDWLAGPSNEIWWCCMFVSWCLDQAGVKAKGFPTYNTDVALSNGGNTRLVNKSQIQRGDILIFDWNWGTAATDHIGFAKGSPYNGYVDTIEGNVNNAVQNKTRSLDTIRYVIRPDYEKSNTPAPEPVVDGTLEVDGIAGPKTVATWQHQLNTAVDGKISGQYQPNAKYFTAVTAVTWEDAGSPFVEAIQNKVGAEADGYWGKDTSRKIQTWLIENGYNCGADGADGYFGTNSAKALQSSLNDNKWV